jgi:hypothetical protein
VHQSVHALKPIPPKLPPRLRRAIEIQISIARARKGIRRRTESVALPALEWSYLALLGAELHRAIQTGWLCALAEAENVDLLVWISKRRIAALANATIPRAECPLLRRRSARPRPPQTSQSPRAEPSSIETSCSPQLRAPRTPKYMGSHEVLFCGGDNNFFQPHRLCCSAWRISHSRARGKPGPISVLRTP